MVQMEVPVNWHARACLCLRPEAGRKKVIELFRGHLFEVVQAALARPESEQLRLFIAGDTLERKLTWAAISALADRPDYPVMI